MKTLVTLILALVLHLLLGWAWTLGAGVVGGLWAGRRGWLVGALGVGLGWLVLVVYSYLAAAPAVGEMTRVMGALMGGLGGWVVVLATVLLGTLLGLLGGIIGGQLHLLFTDFRTRRAVAATPSAPPTETSI